MGEGQIIVDEDAREGVAALGDPHTPAERLDALWRAGGLRTEAERLALLGNPGAPPGLLWRALTGGTYTEKERQRRSEVLWENPVLALLPLEAPGCDWMPLEAALWLAARPGAPSWLVEALSWSAHAPVRREVAKRSELGAGVALRLARDPDHGVRWAAAQNLCAPLAGLLWMCEEPPNSARGALGGRSDLTEELAIRLARDPDHTVRAQVAEHPALPVGEMEALARSGSSLVVKALARNPRLPGPLLWSLPRGRKPDDALWMALARHPNAPPALLRELATRPNVGVLKAVAGNPGAPGEALELIWQKARGPELRELLARHPNTPGPVLQALAQDPGMALRVLENTSAPRALALGLSLHRDAGIRAKARGRLRAREAAPEE